MSTAWLLSFFFQPFTMVASGLSPGSLSPVLGFDVVALCAGGVVMNASKKTLDISERFGHPVAVHFSGAAPASKASNMGVERGFFIGYLSELPGYREVLGVPLNVNTAQAFLLPEVQNSGGYTMNKQEKNTQTIVPIFPDDYKVIKKTKEDGTIIFEHPVGEEVETYTNTLDMMMEIIVNRFEALGKLTVDDDYDRIGFLIEALVEGARREIYEVFHFLDMSIGEINCTIVQRNQTIYRHGRILAVELKGKEQQS